MTIEDIPGGNGLIEAFETKRQQVHATQCSLGQLFSRQRGTTDGARGAQPAEETYRAIEAEELGGKMRNA